MQLKLAGELAAFEVDTGTRLDVLQVSQFPPIVTSNIRDFSENLLDNCIAMGERMKSNLEALMEKHQVIGDVRGKGLFLGAELVADRETKEPVDEKLAQAVVAECGNQNVIIGVTNRSIPGKNNTLCFSPALIVTPEDVDKITDAVDVALTKVFG